jgi:hypothetical protein
MAEITAFCLYLPRQPHGLGPIGGDILDRSAALARRIRPRG